MKTWLKLTAFGSAIMFAVCGLAFCVTFGIDYLMNGAQLRPWAEIGTSVISFGVIIVLGNAAVSAFILRGGK